MSDAASNDIDLDEALAFAHDLADRADAISMARFRAGDLLVAAKADRSPVTEADRAIEAVLRERIGERWPAHAVLGEEFGGDGAGDAAWRWVIDPIDGTRSYVRGNETWGTLIALQHDGQSLVAVASTPAFGRRYAAVRGRGATEDGAPITVSEVDRLDRAMFAHTSVSGFARSGMSPGLVGLAQRCWDARGLGNTHSHLAVARGVADLAWTARGQVWDFAALSLIVEEAGGRFIDRSRDSPIGGTGLSTNAALHDEVAALSRAG